MNKSQAIDLISGKLFDGKALPTDGEPPFNLLIEGGLDSLDFIELLFEIENVSGIKIQEDDIDKFELKTLQNLVNYINDQDNLSE